MITKNKQKKDISKVQFTILKQTKIIPKKSTTDMFQFTKNATPNNNENWCIF